MHSVCYATVFCFLSQLWVYISWLLLSMFYQCLVWKLDSRVRMIHFIHFHLRSAPRPPRCALRSQVFWVMGTWEKWSRMTGLHNSRNLSGNHVRPSCSIGARDKNFQQVDIKPVWFGLGWITPVVLHSERHFRRNTNSCHAAAFHIVSSERFSSSWPGLTSHARAKSQVFYKLVTSS